jgi:N-acetylmuramoyl-L-alanine amidase
VTKRREYPGVLKMKNVTPSFNVRGIEKTIVGKNILLKGVLPTLASMLLLASPATAASLESWQFESNQNRLSFTTAGGVQPRAQLLANPTRLVIDLPGTTIGRSRRSQYFGGTIKEIRVGQLDPGTARMVVEFAEGYTVDPSQIKFDGLSASEFLRHQLETSPPHRGPQLFLVMLKPSSRIFKSASRALS